MVGHPLCLRLLLLCPLSCPSLLPSFLSSGLLCWDPPKGDPRCPFPGPRRSPSPTCTHRASEPVLGGRLLPSALMPWPCTQAVPGAPASEALPEGPGPTAPACRALCLRASPSAPSLELSVVAGVRSSVSPFSFHPPPPSPVLSLHLLSLSSCRCGLSFLSMLLCGFQLPPRVFDCLCAPPSWLVFTLSSLKVS